MRPLAHEVSKERNSVPAPCAHPRPHLGNAAETSIRATRSATRFRHPHPEWVNRIQIQPRDFLGERFAPSPCADL